MIVADRTGLFALFKLVHIEHVLTARTLEQQILGYFGGRSLRLVLLFLVKTVLDHFKQIF